MSDRRTNTVLYWSASALLAGVVVFGMTLPLLSIGRYIPLDPNEGWNAYFGDAAVSGGVLYPSADALITNNYPPLSFYIVGAIGHLTGDNIFAGRVVALLSLLFVAWSIYYWLRLVHLQLVHLPLANRPTRTLADIRAGWPLGPRRPPKGAVLVDGQAARLPTASAMFAGNRGELSAGHRGEPSADHCSEPFASHRGELFAGHRVGLFAALTFLAYAVTYGRVYVAMDDPQWLAHALMMGGLLVLWAGKDDTRHIVFGAVLMMAAGWTKHLLIPLPVTVTLWLLWRSRPAFAKWLVSVSMTLAVAVALAWWLHGPRLFQSLNEPREYFRGKAISEAATALRCFAPLVVLWFAAVVRGRLGEGNNEQLGERLGGDRPGGARHRLIGERLVGVRLGGVRLGGRPLDAVRLIGELRLDGLRLVGERLGFVSLYLVTSTAVALFAAGGAGVDVNSFFDPMIALCLATGLAIESLGILPPTRGSLVTGRTPARVSRAIWAPTAALSLAIFVVGYAVTLAPLELEGIRHIDADERSALRDIEVIKADGQGRAACEMLNLCYWAKSAFMVDFFYFGQKLKTGVLPRTACADTFEHSDITLVQLEHNPKWRAKLLPNDCDVLIMTKYHAVRDSNFGPLLARPGVTAAR